MKHLFYFFLLCCTIAIVFSCAKDDPVFKGTEKAVDVRTSQQNVDVCHLTSSGESHTITINENALDAHLAHGDSEGECTDCDPNSCTFCDYLDYFDFDEPIVEPCDYPGFVGDYYCQKEFNYGVTEGCGGASIEGWALLADHDWNLCFPDPDGENDDGDIWSFYRTDGCGNWEGHVLVSYSDANNSNNSFFFLFSDCTQTAYDQAVYCASVIEGINAALATPLVNQEDCLLYIPPCPDMTSNEGVQDELEASRKSIELKDPHINYPDEIKKIIEDLRRNQMTKNINH
jgi:hypothetical protein